MSRSYFRRRGVDRRRLGGRRRRPPTFPMRRALPTPSTSRSMPIAGPAPISAAISAMPGARSTTTRPGRRVFRAACRAATTGRPVRGCSASKATSRRPAPTTLRALEVLQPVVRHRARPGRLCVQQHPVLRHRRSGVRRIARRDLRPVGIPYQRRLDRGRRRRIRLRPELERQGRISLRRSRQQQLTITGVPNGYRFGLVRAGVNYHFWIATRKHIRLTLQPPGRHPGGSFAPRGRKRERVCSANRGWPA